MKLGLKGVSAIAVAIASPAAAVPRDFTQRVNRLVDQSYPASAPGAAVIVTDHGKVVYERGRGLADIAAKKPITPLPSSASARSRSSSLPRRCCSSPTKASFRSPTRCRNSFPIIRSPARARPFASC